MAKFWICVFVAIFVLSATTNADEETATAGEEKSFAIELTAATFDEAIKTNNHFVMFFVQWCGHCKRLHPIWEQLAEMSNVYDDPKVIIAKVDCTQEQELCTKHDVTAYPTLRLFKKDETESVKFKGARDMPTLTDFINQQLHSEEDITIIRSDEAVPKPALMELTDENFATHVASGNHFVKFYAPWCSHCQRLAPTWDTLARTLQNTDAVSVAKIDCTLYRPTCKDFDVKGYPTLLWIEDGKKIEKYSGGRDHDALKLYVEKMLHASGKEIVPPPTVAADVVEPEVEPEAKPEVVDEKDKLAVLALSGEEEFAKTIAEGVAFIKFYAPWCSHCQELSPTWDSLAAQMHAGGNGVTIAKVDCTDAANKQLCMDQEVEGYPTLFAYKSGEKQSEYHGSRSMADMQQYVNKFVGHDEL